MKWFQQLRRLQSMQHPLRASKQTADAVEYRATLWRSIRRAKGFHLDVEHWWQDEKPTSFTGLPRRLPTEPPTCEMAEAIFQDFLYNYIQKF